MAEQNKDLILELQGISKSFPGVQALDHVSFGVRRGEVLALAGENGAGKSTLMKILSGSYRKDAGTIVFDGKEVEIDSPKTAERLGLSIIHQELNVMQNLTAAENIYLGRQPRRHGVIDWKKMNADAAALFARLGIDLDVTARAGSLSIAQQQMVEIAKAVSFDAKLVIMDEPTSSLTAQETNILLEIIRGLSAGGIAVIFITHRMDEIFAAADRAAVLRDGAYIGTREISEIDVSGLISMMIGRTLTQQYPPRNARIGECLLEVEGLGDGGRVQDISFRVHAGEVLGLAGLVGAGRTETARMIFGADRKKTGKILLRGREVSSRSPRDAIRNGLALVTEDRKQEGLLLRQSVQANTVMVALEKICRRKIIHYPSARRTAEAYVKDLRIATPSVDQRAVFLSGGNQQKVVLAKWLFSDAEVMILDEPTRGIDVGSKREIYEIINRLAEGGKAIVVISSEMEEVMGISDRILVMYEGRIAGEVRREDFSQQLISEFAIGGRKL